MCERPSFAFDGTDFLAWTDHLPSAVRPVLALAVGALRGRRGGGGGSVEAKAVGSALLVAAVAEDAALAAGHMTGVLAVMPSREIITRTKYENIAAQTNADAASASGSADGPDPWPPEFLRRSRRQLAAATLAWLMGRAWPAAYGPSPDQPGCRADKDDLRATLAKATGRTRAHRAATLAESLQEGQ